MLCPRYYETVSDVLHSVKKMEESLKRLKQARKTNPANPSGSSSSGGMSDDDKIRLQLALDVEYLGEQVTALRRQSRGSAAEFRGHLAVLVSPEVPPRGPGGWSPMLERGQVPKMLEVQIFAPRT